MINPFKTKSTNLYAYPPVRFMEKGNKGSEVRCLDFSDLTFSIPLLNFLKS